MLEQLRKLREQMKACGIDAYVIGEIIEGDEKVIL